MITSKLKKLHARLVHGMTVREILIQMVIGREIFMPDVGCISSQSRLRISVCKRLVLPQHGKFNGWSENFVSRINPSLHSHPKIYPC